MKFLFSLIFLFSVTGYLQGQNLSLKKRTAISALDAKAKEANGNIRFYDSKKKRIITVEDASITATENGIKIEVTLVQDGSPKTTFTSEFNPADIAYIYDVDVPDESPVGQIKIILNNKIGYKTNYTRKGPVEQSYEENIFLNYLQVDDNNFLQIQSALFKLKETYAAEENEPLQPMAKVMNTYKDFWVSAEGASNTYELKKVYVNGCTMRMIYNLKSISRSGDDNQMLLTIIPLGDIDDVRFDKNKSKPNCIILESGKKGFETYVLRDKKYEPTRSVKEIPLFVDVTSDWKRNELMELLKVRVKECGGGKIKL